MKKNGKPAIDGAEEISMLTVSEATLQELLDQRAALDQHAIVVITDLQGTITSVNEKFCAISKYSKDELIGQNLRILNSGYHPKEFFRQMYQTIAGGRVWRGEIRNRAKDGSIYWVEATIVPTLGPEGKPRQYVATRVDITKRKAAEALSDRTIKELADQSYALDQHAIVAETDIQGTITYVNDRFCTISQYSRDELIGQNHRILNSGYHPKDFFQQMYRTIAGGGVWRGDIQNRAKDGSIYWVATTVVPTLGPEGKPQRYVAIRADITARKLAQKALSESEERFHTMANAIPQLAWMADAGGNIFWYNDRWYEYTGTTFEEMQGWGWQAVHDPAVLPTVMERWKAALANGTPFEMEFPLRRADGSFGLFLTRVVPTQNSENRVLQWFGTNTDITELRRAEAVRERLAAVVESSDDAIIAKTLEGEITAWNRGAEKVFGYSSAEALGHSMTMLIPQEQPDEEPRILARIARGESIPQFETVRVRKGGERIYVSVTISPIRDTSGAIVGASKVARDVTARKLADKFLREQAKVMDLAQVMVRNKKGCISLWTQGSEKIYGYSSQEAVGQISHELLQTQFPAPLAEIEAKLERTGVWEGELRHRKRDGSHIVASSVWRLHADTLGLREVVLESNTDITARKLAEERVATQAKELMVSRQALEGQSEILRSVLDGMTEGLAAVNEQGNLIIWNMAAEKILGLGTTDAPSEEWSDHYGLFLNDMVTPFPEDQLPVIRASRGEVNTTEMFVRNHEIPHGRWIEVNASPRKDKNGKVCGGVAAFRDVTQIKADEREIRELNQQLNQRNQSLELSNIELQQFAYIASHDLQSPLRSISGFVQLLRMEYEGKLDEQADDWIRRTVKAIDQMQTLIRDLLAYSRVDSRSRPLADTSMKGVFDGAVALLESSIQDSGGRVTCGELPTVMGDSSLLVQLMQNLIGNALKYHGEKTPEVHVSAERNRNESTFTVRDNGIGISSEFHERIFEVFKRLHDQTEYPGTGIGLAVCRRVVNRHGGRIWVESEPGRGSAFHFTIRDPGVQNNDR